MVLYDLLRPAKKTLLRTSEPSLGRDACPSFPGTLLASMERPAFWNSLRLGKTERLGHRRARSCGFQTLYPESSLEKLQGHLRGWRAV